jgi:PelA/Pel-15E family pectate lyase
MRLLGALLLIVSCSQAMAAVDGARRYLKQPDPWFTSDEGKRITDNILSHQSPLGGWPKNVDTTATRYQGKPEDLHPTFDNSATTDELRFLARAFDATGDPRLDECFNRGLDYILKAQYPSGGWPQFYPPDRAYHRYITFNDDAIVRLMQFLREVWREAPYAFVEEPKRRDAKAAFDRGVECILKCQIKVDGKLTAWCAQHDELDYSPRPGRAYELVSLSGSESVGIVRLLMSLDDPSPQVIAAVDGAAAWFQSAKLSGIRSVLEDDPEAPRGKNKVVVKDPDAPPMWARFYEIGSNRPIFSDRDGIAKHDLSEIGYERRNGYAWLGYWPATLLESEYPAWRAKRGTTCSSAIPLPKSSA